MFPRFDSTACFAALLGGDEHGRWKIAPTAEVTAVERRYRDGTLILETVFETRDGRAMLIDFMPMKTSGHVVRMVVGLSGRVEFAVDLAIRFDYGSSVPWVERKDAHTLTAVAGPEMLVLRSPVALHPQDHHTASLFHVDEGERKVFTLAYQASFAPLLDQIDADRALETTAAYWREFSDRCPDVGPWTAQVKRSLITLKAMTYAPTGGIVAAVTTSLPEQLGGERNWDYRYCWLRDATMTLLAFMNLGYFEEAQAWRDWLLRSVAGNPEQIQIMYGVGGERRLQEYELPWLSGYENSLPVRVGNGAATQVQLDVYGEVADAMIQALRGGMTQHPRSLAISRWSCLIWRRSGTCRMRASGRYAPSRATLRIRKSWPGWPLTVTPRRLPRLPRAMRIVRWQCIIGRWRTRSMPMSVATVSMPSLAASCRLMARQRWTPACCRLC